MSVDSEFKEQVRSPLKKLLLGSMIGSLIIALSLCLCPILAWTWYNLSAAQTEQQQLLSLDQQFGTPRSPIPASMTEDNFLPLKIGSLNRYGEIGRRECDAASCLSAFYKTEQGQYLSLDITISDWNDSAKAAQVLKDTGYRAGDCGPEGGGHSGLRNGSAISYIYLSCGYYISPEYLSAIAWTNGKWFIRIGGNYASMSEFLKHYPY